MTLFEEGQYLCISATRFEKFARHGPTHRLALLRAERFLAEPRAK
jgi:hypothetical protein